LLERIGALKAELAEVRRTRGLQRQARKRAPCPTVALVGYTNAGKSTLFNRLTHAEVLAQDMLFATLDPTLRRLQLPGGRPGVLSDTVGFISDLPHELVEAFRATLEEVREADVIVHVRDIAGPDSVAEGEDVTKVLAELGIEASSERTMLEVWNKADLVEPALRDDLAEAAQRAGAIAVSAATGEGIDALLRRLATLVDAGPDLILELAPSDGEALAWLYRHGRVTAREDINGSVVLSARLDSQALGRFERMRPGAFGPPAGSAGVRPD
jgi:GTP-binding protein HflX